jgi:triacylglycerol lipase
MRHWSFSLLLAACTSGTATVAAPEVADEPSAPEPDPVAETDLPPTEPAPEEQGPTVDSGPAVPPPIVLAHGFFGFEDFAGVDFVTYYFGVKRALEEAGEPAVFTPAVDPFSDSETRGRQLLAAIEQILADTGADRVTLVAHSQAGLDARVVASLRPELIEAVVTVATPHAGTPVADVAVGLVPYPGAQAVVDALVRAVSGPLWAAAGDTTSLFDSLEQLSTRGVASLSRRFPDDPSVPWYSIGGRTGYNDGAGVCGARDRPRFITRYDDQLDPTDLLLVATEAVLDGGLFGDEANDGLVRVMDSKKGRFLGCIPADHLDEIGHLLGDEPGLFNDFDHRQFYVDLVAWLRAEGH